MIFPSLVETIKNIQKKRDETVQTSSEYRLLLVIKARWIIISLLVIHGIIGFAIYYYTNYISPDMFAKVDVISGFQKTAFFPSLIVLFMSAYNSFYHFSWHKLPKFWKPRVKFLIFVQLYIDIVVILTLIHYTGGVASWLWPLFLLLNIELAFLLYDTFEILLVGFSAGVGYTFLLLLEYLGIISVYSIPYMPQNINYNYAFIFLMIVWVNIFCAFSLIISLFLHKSEQSVLKDRIIRDGLTNLYNKRYFTHRLNSEIKRAQRYNRIVSLVIFDIDNFKEYNDTYGHMQGDILLSWIADIFKLNTRRSDDTPSYEIDIPCRFGGDELAIILPETPTNESLETAEKILQDIDQLTTGAVTLAERIRKIIESSQFVEGKRVTMSAGVACFPVNGSNYKQLVEEADKALYKAKNSGRNKTCVSKYKAVRIKPSVSEVKASGS